MRLLSKEYRIHYSESFRLALPVVVGQVSHMLALLADSAMVGRISSTQLAACSVANSAFIFVYVTAIGIAIGLTPLIGRAYGAKEEGNIPAYIANGFVLNFSVGVIAFAALYIFSFFFHVLGQTKEVTELAVPYLRILSFSAIPYSLFLTLKQYADAMSFTKPGAIVGLLGNGFNIFINYLLIYGNWGSPRMELNGAGTATTIARFCMGFVMLFVLLRNPRLKAHLQAVSIRLVDKEKIREIWRTGFQIGIQMWFEVGAFAMGTMMMGWIGAIALAAHHVALGICALAFLMVTGVSQAATIRISQYLGEGKIQRMISAGYAAYVISFAFNMFTAAVFIFFGRELVLVFTPDEAVVKTGTVLLAIGGLFQIVDGAQAVALGILRGMGDVKKPTYITTVAYWVITIPLCYILAIPAGIGPEGIWYGYLIGLVFAAIALFARFRKMAVKLTSAS